VCFVTLLSLHETPLRHAFRAASDVDYDHRKRVRTPPCRAREALMQLDEPKRREARLQPAIVKQRLDTTHETIIEEQRPASESPGPL
jgi:hypothetical protein